MTKSIVLFYFLILVGISHWALPVFNDGNDMLFFSTWSLFSDKTQSSVVDITWDNGESYLLRDHDRFFTQSKIDRTLFYQLVKDRKINDIKNQFSSLLIQYCRCGYLELQILSGSLYQHFILKEKLKVLEKTQL